MRARGSIVEAIALAELAHLVIDGARIDPEATAGAAAVAEHQVLGDREALDQPEVLVHHADARVDRLARRREVDPLAVEEDLALVGRYRPVRMCDSVVLPAPFSPSSACTSPAAASKSTRSFATTPGNRFVMPRIETAAGCAAVIDPRGRRRSRARRARRDGGARPPTRRRRERRSSPRTAARSSRAQSGRG